MSPTVVRERLSRWAEASRQPAPVGTVVTHREARRLFTTWTASILKRRDAPQPASDTLTLDDLATMYVTQELHHPDRRPAARAEAIRQMRAVCIAVVPRPGNGTVRLGALPVAAITKPLIEAFRLTRRHDAEANVNALAAVERLKAEGAPIPADLRERARRAKLAPKSGRVATNRLLERFRRLYRWAIEQELLDASPFSRHGVAMIRLDKKAETPRDRRLEGDEETRLLAHAGDHLRACIIAALETGMRKGEILGLRWQHVHLEAGRLSLPGPLTKTGESRDGRDYAAPGDAPADAPVRKAGPVLPADGVRVRDCGR